METSRRSVGTYTSGFSEGSGGPSQNPTPIGLDPEVPLPAFRDHAGVLDRRRKLAGPIVDADSVGRLRQRVPRVPQRRGPQPGGGHRRAQDRAVGNPGNKLADTGDLMNPELFREYDIRGIADTDLADDSVETPGPRSRHLLRPHGAARVTLGRDVRLSSTRLRDALARGLTRTGLTVIDIGVCPTPLLYYSLHRLGPEAGVMITGSHNPPRYNGFKVALGTEPSTAPRSGRSGRSLKRPTSLAAKAAWKRHP